MSAPSPAPAGPPTLDDLKRLTDAITEAQGKVDEASAERKAAIKALHAGGVDYKDMADAMGVTVQTVYRIAPLGKGRR